MAAKSGFPIEVKSGSVSIKIYLTPTRGYDAYTVSYCVDGRRKRTTFAELEKAKREAKRIAARISSGDFTEATLDPEARAAYARSIELLKPCGIALEVAAAQFAEASKVLNGRSILEAAQFYAKRNPSAMPERTVAEVVEELIEAKRQDGLSALAVKDLQRLRLVAKDFGMQISALSGKDLDEWLRARPYVARTRNNYRRLLGTLFNFAISRKYLPPDFNELASVSVSREAAGEIEIFTPDEMRAILSHAKPEVVPFLALGAFAGIRHEEIRRLDWADVKLDAGFIELKPLKTKTRNRRLVPIQPNLKSWLAPFATPIGPICVYRNMSKELTRLARSIAGKETETGGRFKSFEWKHNALRHSFISYRMAILKNENQVALEAGNSPAVIFKNYRELVSEGDARAWFSIEPAVPDRVVSGVDFGVSAAQETSIKTGG